MAGATPSLAFIFPSGPEFIMILVVGLLLFGRRLPEVGRTVGKTILQLRQGLQKLKDEMDMDEDIKDVSHTIQDVKRGYDKIVSAPRVLANPGKMLEDLTNESLSSAGPVDTQVVDMPESLFTKSGSEDQESPQEERPTGN